MKKVTLLVIVLISVGVEAQITPEAILGQCPPFPSQQDIVNAMMKREAGVAKVKDYLKILDEAIRKSEAAIDKQWKASDVEGAALRDADKELRRQLGISLEEAQSMSEAELKKRGERKADSILQELGIAKSAKKLENQELSETEMLRIAENMAKKTTGLSIKELQALENMNEEEQIAYIQKKGVLEKVEMKGRKMKHTVVSTHEVDVNNISVSYSAQGKDNLRKLREMETDHFYEKMASRWEADGYKRRTEMLEKQIEDLWSNNGKGFKGPEEQAEHAKKIAAQVAVLEERIEQIREEYCRASVKVWYPRILEKLSILRQLLQEDKRVDASVREVAKLGGLESGQAVVATSGAAVARALQYLNTAKELVTVP